MNPGSVLLTGASGLIGRQCVRPLQALGFRVIAASRRARPVAGVESYGVDILDPQAVRQLCDEVRPSHLLHLAWHDGAKDRWTAAANLDWIGGSLALLRAFAAAGGQRAVLVGSCAEYDWKDIADRPLPESSPLRPVTLYGAAKAATGIAALAGAGALDLSVAWARPFFCFGPGEPEGRLFGDLVRGLASGRQVECTDGLQERDFLSTIDQGRALAALLASPVQGAVNIASGHAIAVRQVIAELAAQMGQTGLVRLGARARPAGDPARIVADVTRLRDEVGFAPDFNLATAVRTTLIAEGVLA